MVLPQVGDVISNLALALLAFLLHSTRIVFLFLLIWAVKESLLYLAPRGFRLVIRLLLLPGDLLHTWPTSWRPGYSAIRLRPGSGSARGAPNGPC